MLHDDSTTAMAPSTAVDDSEQLTDKERGTAPSHANNDLDDVFGSAPASPRAGHEGGDLFGEGESQRGNAEWSDVPRLQEKHETEGYRDGVTKGKAGSVQKGFDEGYGLGATLGLRIGKVLGVLEGIYGAVQTAARDPANGEDREWEAQRRRVEILFGEARKELKTQSLFGKEWWGEDGIWTFKVPGEEEGREVTFPDVAGAHPLVVKWENLVEEEVERWGLDLGLMGGETDEKELGERAGTKEEPPASTAPGAAKELSW